MTVSKQEQKDYGERRLLTLDEAADFLRVSRSTINNWRSLRKIPFIKINGCVRYERADLEKLLAKSKTRRRGQ